MTAADNYLAPFAGRGREPRAVRLPGEGEASGPICGACMVAKRPSPRPSPRLRGEGASCDHPHPEHRPVSDIDVIFANEVEPAFVVDPKNGEARR